MRWKKKEMKTGETRVIRRFLFFPLTIGKETRWLEFANIKQEYSCELYLMFFSARYYWRNIEFL